MLPTSSQHFTGRRFILDTIKDALLPGRDDPRLQRVFVLSGMVGSGKSEVALKFMEENNSRFDAAFWVEASSQTNLEHSFLEIARICGFRRDNLGNTLEDLSSVTSSWLLVADNCDDTNLDYSQFLRPTRAGSILVTTRNNELTAYHHSASVGGLDNSEALELLLKTIGVPKEDLQYYKTAAQSVIDLLGRQPLAIAHAGASINDGLCTLEDYPSMFEQNRVQLLKKQASPTTIRCRYPSIWETFESSMQVLERSYGSSDDTAQKLLWISAYMNKDVSEKIFTLAWQTQEEVSRQTGFVDDRSIESLSAWHMEQAQQSGLLNSSPNGDLRHAQQRLQQLGLLSASLSFDPLVATWVKDRLDPQQQATAWATASAILALSTRQSRKLEEFSRMLQPHLESCFMLWSRVEAQIPFTRDIARTMYGFAWQLHAARSQTSLEIANLLYNRYDQDSQTNDVKAKAAQRLVAKCLSSGGDTQESISMLEALIQSENAQPEINGPYVLTLKHDLAVAFANNHQIRKAIPLLKQLVALHRETLGPEDTYLLTLELDLGRVYAYTKNHKQAIPLLEKILETRNKTLTPGHPSILETQHELAVACLGSKNYQRSTELFEQVLKEDSKTLKPENQEVLATQQSLAVAYMEGGNAGKATRLLEYVVKVYINTLKYEMPHPDLLSSKHALGCAYKRHGQYTRAVEVLKEVVGFEEEVYGAGDTDTKESVATLNAAKKEARKRRLANRVVGIKARRKKKIAKKEKKAATRATEAARKATTNT